MFLQQASYTPSLRWIRVKLGLDTRFHRIFENSPFSAAAVERNHLKLRNPRRYLFEKTLGMPFPRSKTMYRALHYLHTRWPLGSRKVRQLFDKYQPDLVFTNGVATTSTIKCYEFLKLAKKRGIPTVGMIISWDELCVDRITVPCDRYLVWNGAIQSELDHFYGIPESQVRITGIPQMDSYADRLTKRERSAFLKSQGLDPSIPTVLYATSSPEFHPDGPEILRAFLDRLFTQRGRMVQVVIRVSPSDFYDYTPFLRPGVVLQVPGADVSRDDGYRLLNHPAVQELRDTLVSCDVVVNLASTMTIDGAATGTPVVNIGYDSTEIDYYNSVRRSLNHPYMRPVFESSATSIAHDLDELVAHVLRYIDNPSLHEAERAKLAEIVGYKIDGRSSERVTSFLMDFLGTNSEQGPSHRRAHQ